MISESRTRFGVVGGAIGLVLLGLVACRSERRPEHSASDKSPALPHSLASAQRSTLLKVDVHRLPDLIRDRYRCQPDRRFLMAAAELHRLVTGGEPPALKTRFDIDHWQVVAGDHEVGRLPEIPTFPELMELLVAQAHLLGAVESGPGDAIQTHSMRELE